MAKRKSSLSARSEATKAAVAIRAKVEKDIPTSDRVGLSVRLTPDTHEELRKIAFEKRVSIHSLMLEGIDNILDKYAA
jgi:DNA-directed RNA polymerase subunit F